MKFLKNQIPQHNNSTLSATLSEDLAMPCANYIVMGFSTNSVLIASHSTTYEIMNEFVAPKSKRQSTSLSFILQFNFNKLEASLCKSLHRL